MSFLNKMALKGSKNLNNSVESKKNVPQIRTQYRILDEAVRNRRNRQQVEKLERDNFHEDPHANFVMHKKAPKFDDTAIQPGQSTSVSVSGYGSGPGSRKAHQAAHKTKLISFSSLLEEEAKSPAPNYLSVVAPAPDKMYIEDKLLMKINKRHFCSVCGFNAPYTCITCGMRYCSLQCMQTHRDTRCLKWTV